MYVYMVSRIYIGCTGMVIAINIKDALNTSICVELFIYILPVSSVNYHYTLLSRTILPTTHTIHTYTADTRTIHIETLLTIIFHLEKVNVERRRVDTSPPENLTKRLGDIVR